MWSWDQTNPLNKSLHGISLSPASMSSARALFILRLSDVIASFLPRNREFEKLEYHKNHVRYTSATHYPPHTEPQSSSLEQQRHLVVPRHPEKYRWPKNPPSILLGNQHPRKSPTTTGWHLRRSSRQVRQHRGLTVAEAFSPHSLLKSSLYITSDRLQRANRAKIR